MSVPRYSFQVSNLVFEVWDHKPKIKELKEVTQVHGNVVVEASKINTPIEADGLISTNKESLAIKTADCLAVAFISDSGISLVHAGWRGLKDHILLDRQIKSLNPDKIFIGPHIRIKNYEVSLDFTKNFPKSNNFKEIEGRIFFDMTKEAIDQLKECYPLAEIIDCGLDTYSDDRFYSYRNGDLELRNWNILRKI